MKSVKQAYFELSCMIEGAIEKEYKFCMAFYSHYMRSVKKPFIYLQYQMLFQCCNYKKIDTIAASINFFLHNFKFVYLFSAAPYGALL